MAAVILAIAGVSVLVRKRREASRSIVAGHSRDEVITENAAPIVVQHQQEPQPPAVRAGVPCKVKSCSRSFASTGEMLRHVAINH
jgi:hypothetical protein